MVPETDYEGPDITLNLTAQYIYSQANYYKKILQKWDSHILDRQNTKYRLREDLKVLQKPFWFGENDLKSLKSLKSVKNE